MFVVQNFQFFKQFFDLFKNRTKKAIPSSGGFVIRPSIISGFAIRQTPSSGGFVIRPSIILGFAIRQTPHRLNSLRNDYLKQTFHPRIISGGTIQIILCPRYNLLPHRILMNIVKFLSIKIIGINVFHMIVFLPELEIRYLLIVGCSKLKMCL